MSSIELRCNMESKSLGTDEIITSWNAARNSEYVFAAIVVELHRSPVVGVGADETDLGNLEPVRI